MSDARPLRLVRGPTRDLRPDQSPEPLWREVLGARLRGRRRARGLTLTEVAGRAGVSPQYLSEIERGKKDPSSEMLAAVAGALGARVLDLTGVVPGGTGTARPALRRSRDAQLLAA